MYYILYEGLQIESNEPVYYTLYTKINITIHRHTIVYIYIYSDSNNLRSNP